MGDVLSIKKMQAAALAAVAAVALGCSLSFAAPTAYAADDLQAGSELTIQSKEPVLDGPAVEAWVPVNEKTAAEVTNTTEGQTGKWTITSADETIATAAIEGDGKAATITVTGVKAGMTELTITFTTDSDVAGSTTMKVLVLEKSGSNDSVGLYTVDNGSVYLASLSESGTRVRVPVRVTLSGYDDKVLVTKVYKEALKDNDKVEILSVGKNVKSIGAKAFAGCTALQKARIGAGLKSIGAKAFQGDENLTKITIASKKLTADKIKNCFKGSSIKTVLVPKSKVADYKKIFTKEICGKDVKVKAMN